MVMTMMTMILGACCVMVLVMLGVLCMMVAIDVRKPLGISVSIRKRNTSIR